MIVVLDVETTGLDPKTAAICELALVTMTDKGQITGTFSTLIKPSNPIPPEASAIHHITNDMIKKAPNETKALLMASEAMGYEKPICYAAHNAAFDASFLPALSPWLCTWRVAKHLWPEAPAHGNSVLRYWLPKLDAEIIKTSNAIRGDSLHDYEGPMDLPSHRALPDAWVTAHVLKRMLKMKPLEKLLELSTQPILLRTCHFGEHYGKPWDQVPVGFCEWLLSKGPRRSNTNGGRDIGFDDDTRYTALHYYTQATKEDKVVKLRGAIEQTGPTK